MPPKPGDRYPHVTIQKLLVGRSRSWVVMDACSLDVGAITLGGRIVDAKQQPVAQRQLFHDPLQQRSAHLFALASQAAQEVIIFIVAFANACGTQPTRDGAASTGEQQTRQDLWERIPLASIEHQRQNCDPTRQFGGKLPRSHPWLSCVW